MASPAVLYQAGDHASRPANGSGCVLYSCTDHDLVYRDDGTSWTTFMTLIGGSGGDIATDTIWDAAGDLAVGSGANTAAKLTIGAAGGHVARVNGAVAWNSGTSFPTAATGDRYWRTDLGMEFYYDGTRWLSTQLNQIQLVNTDALLALTATGALRAVKPVWGVTGNDIWVEDFQAWFFVGSGASALSASHKWVGVLTRTGGTGIGTINIDSGASNAHRQSSIVAVDALLGGTTFELQVIWTKTGTPGGLFVQCAVSYRYVAT